ncbi:MAG: YheU family protein [Gammaproteobacteria bacterium]|nr:YheU family protein [Gammaproteobacteria bacterium]MDP7455183.1 YheU family protein [Gammaproteobacteria bacterium]
MEIPFSELSSDAVKAIIEEFITREGTEYGSQEFSLAEKTEQVRRQMEKGEVYIDYDAESKTCQLVSRKPGNL